MILTIQDAFNTTFFFEEEEADYWLVGRIWQSEMLHICFGRIHIKIGKYSAH
jgi:hypothetical protein